MVGSSRGGETSICTCMNVYNYLLERSDFMLFGIVFAMIMKAICGNMLDD